MVVEVVSEGEEFMRKDKVLANICIVMVKIILQSWDLQGKTTAHQVNLQEDKHALLPF